MKQVSRQQAAVSNQQSAVSRQLLIVTMLALTAAGVARAQQPRSNIFEVRIYTIAPDSMEPFVKWMEPVTRWQETVGMQIAGQFAAAAQNRYVWIREYPDEATRLKRFEDVYGSGGMKQFGTPPGLQSTEVYLATAPQSSHLQVASTPRKPMPAPASGSAIYEFRVYDVKAGMASTFATYMSDRMIPWQERAYKVNVFGQFLPYAKVAGSARGGTVTPEERTYIWGRRFANENERLEKYKMYKDPAFQSVGAPADAGFEKARIIILANPTTFSRLQ